jgi:hypothetical protein
MNTATDTPAEALSSDEAYAAEHARTELLRAQASPLDQSLARKNDRPTTARAPSLWDVAEPLNMPSMSLDPGQIRAHEHFDELEGWNTEQAVAALEALQTVAKQLIDARQVLRANEVKHEAELILELDDLHSRLAPTATKKVDAALTSLGKAIASHEAALNAQVKDNASGQEIRAFVRSLKPAERLATLRRAIDSGDATTVGALLGSPASYLTGLDLADDARSALLRQWHTKLDPVKAKQLALMKHCAASLEKAGSVFVASADAMLGVKGTTAARLRASRQKVKTALGPIMPSA